MRRSIFLTVLATLLLAASTAALAGPIHSRAAGDRAVQIRLGGFFPEGGGEFWDGNEETFTLDISDFDDFILGFSYVYGFSNNLEFGVNIDFYDSTVLSQYADFVDESGFPILHDTELAIAPLTLDVRFIPGGRYRIRGHRQVLKPVFYIGGGIGVSFYEYEEIGDFLDFTFDPAVVTPGRFKEDGQSFQTHALAGVELPVGEDFSLMFESRYTWADDDLGGDFAGLGGIELGGPAAYAGLSFRF